MATAGFYKAQIISLSRKLNTFTPIPRSLFECESVLQKLEERMSKVYMRKIKLLSDNLGIDTPVLFDYSEIEETYYDLERLYNGCKNR